MKLGLGCLGYLVALAVVGFIVYQMTSAHLPPELHYFVVVPASLLLTTGLSNLWTLVRGYGQGDRSRTAMLARARTGDPPSQDGHLLVTGAVRAEGAALRAPLSGVECVAYQYRLYTSQWLPSNKLRIVPIYWGYASRPFVIDSPKQAFRVMAVPQLGDAPTQHDSNESRERAKTYVAATRYELKKSIGGIATSAAAMFRDLVAEPTGESRHDWQADDIDIEIDKLLMEEIVVPVGATVSVSGRWSTERRAIVPGDIGEGQLGVTLVSGAAEELGRSGSAELPFSFTSVAVTGVSLLLAGAALVWFSTSGLLATWWRSN